MKKITIILFAALAMITSPLQVSAAKQPAAMTQADPGHASQKEITALETRLMAIKALDKSDLSRSEKKQLRNEVTYIQKKMVANSGGVYISAGAIIIIVILLIILL